VREKKGRNGGEQHPPIFRGKVPRRGGKETVELDQRKTFRSEKRKGPAETMLPLPEKKTRQQKCTLKKRSSSRKEKPLWPRAPDSGENAPLKGFSSFKRVSGRKRLSSTEETRDSLPPEKGGKKFSTGEEKNQYFLAKKIGLENEKGGRRRKERACPASTPKGKGGNTPTLLTIGGRRKTEGGGVFEKTLRAKERGPLPKIKEGPFPGNTFICSTFTETGILLNQQKRKKQAAGTKSGGKKKGVGHQERK